jgi:hypothetical protein
MKVSGELSPDAVEVGRNDPERHSAIEIDDAFDGGVWWRFVSEPR